MLKISENTIASFEKNQERDFRLRALTYVRKENIASKEMDDMYLNEVLSFTEDFSAKVAILAEQTRLSLFVFGLVHGPKAFFSEDVKEFLDDTRIPERIRVRKLIQLSEAKR